MDDRREPLDDPAYAAFAWSRYRRLMTWMTLVAVVAAALGVAALWHQLGPLPLHMAIAAALGIGLSIMMAAALMGLIFLSSGTGHDEAVDRADRHEDAPIWRDRR